MGHGVHHPIDRPLSASILVLGTAEFRTSQLESFLKTSELNAAALDWAVAQCEFGGCEEWDGTLKGVDSVSDIEGKRFTPSTDWSQGGPIIEREQIEVSPMGDGEWRAQIFLVHGHQYFRKYGPDPLTAAMRCYVQHKLGDTVEMPAALEE